MPASDPCDIWVEGIAKGGTRFQRLRLPRGSQTPSHHTWERWSKKWLSGRLPGIITSQHPMTSCSASLHLCLYHLGKKVNIVACRDFFFFAGSGMGDFFPIFHSPFLAKKNFYRQFAWKTWDWMFRERSHHLQLWKKSLRVIWMSLPLLAYITLFAQDLERSSYSLIPHWLPSHANCSIPKPATKWNRTVPRELQENISQQKHSMRSRSTFGIYHASCVPVKVYHLISRKSPDLQHFCLPWCDCLAPVSCHSQLMWERSMVGHHYKVFLPCRYSRWNKLKTRTEIKCVLSCSVMSSSLQPHEL